LYEENKRSMTFHLTDCLVLETDCDIYRNIFKMYFVLYVQKYFALSVTQLQGPSCLYHKTQRRRSSCIGAAMRHWHRPFRGNHSRVKIKTPCIYQIYWTTFSEVFKYEKN